jgi:hypothetical protein
MLQTAGLVYSDSFSHYLLIYMPKTSYALSLLQQLLNSDQEEPERCLFEESLYTKLFVGAVLPVLVTMLMLLAITLPWHMFGVTLGMRRIFSLLRLGKDIISTFIASRRGLKLKWDGAGRLNVGTFARVSPAEHPALQKHAAGWRRHISFALQAYHAEGDRTTAVLPQHEV